MADTPLDFRPLWVAETQAILDSTRAEAEGIVQAIIDRAYIISMAWPVTHKACAVFMFERAKVEMAAGHPGLQIVARIPLNAAVLLEQLRYGRNFPPQTISARLENSRELVQLGIHVTR